MNCTLARGFVAVRSRGYARSPDTGVRVGGSAGENPVRSLRTRTSASETSGVDVTPSLEPITLTEGALRHLNKLGKEKAQNPIILRVGVKSGGCSGMSYVMDFVEPGSQTVDGDVVVDKGDVQIWIDPKSLLYLFGLQLDFSDELIGGGFKFTNPNASTSCGCGTSFSV